MNPYAPPAPSPASPPPTPEGGSGPIPWTPSDLVGHAWTLFKPVGVTLAVAVLITLVAGQVPSGVMRVVNATEALPRTEPAYKALAIATSVVGFVVGTFFRAGTITMSLKVARGQPISVADVFSGGPHLVPLLVNAFLSTLVAAIGFLVFIVPGVMLTYGLMLGPYYVVDQRLGPIAAMRASWESTKGQKVNLFVLSLLCALVVLLGVMACGFGALVAIPVINIATTLAYMHIAGRLGPNDPGHPLSGLMNAPPPPPSAGPNPYIP